VGWPELKWTCTHSSSINYGLCPTWLDLVPK